MKTSIKSVLFVVALFGLSISGAQGGMIPVSNYSFEDANGIEGGLVAAPLANWVQTSSNPSLPTAGYSQKLDASEGTCRGLLWTPEGSASQGGAIWTQVLSTNVAPNTIYSLTVAVGGRAPTDRGDGTYSQDGGAYDFSLYAGGTELVSGSQLHYVDTGTMHYVDATITYDPTAPGAPVPVAGSALTIVLRGIANTWDPAINPQSWTVYDNVRLTSEAVVPEPGTLVLLTTCLLGLVCYAWRKRK